MTTEQVIQIRKLLKDRDGDKANPIRIILDNMLIADERKHLVMWDDTNGLLKVVRPNSDYSKAECPIEFLVYSYDNIQAMSIAVTPDRFRHVTSPMVGTLTSKSSIDNLISEFSLVDADLKTFTNEEINHIITGVTVTSKSGNSTVAKGGTLELKATVDGTYQPIQSVTWSIDGQVSETSVIDKFGELTVGADETATVITVTATSVADTSKYSDFEVTITASV